MARSVMCVPCSEEFPSEAAFQAHKDSNHTIPGTPIGSPDMPTPSPEFLEAVQRIEASKEELQAHKAELESALAEAKANEPPPQPITLTYLYIGVCPVCKSQIKSLELDVEERHFVTAYCLTCNRQIESREEKKL